MSVRDTPVIADSLGVDLVPTGVRVYPAGREDTHRHDFAQVLFGRQGCLELDVEGRACRVDADTGLVIPIAFRHDFVSRHGAALLVVDLEDGSGLDRVRPFRSRMQAASPLTRAALLGSIGLGERVLRRRRIDPVGFARVLDHHLAEHWPTERMARLHALSVAQFHARWRALTGLTPQAWLRARRLERAIALIERGTTLDGAAMRVGYRSGSALATALRRDFGFRVGARGAQP